MSKKPSLMISKHTRLKNAQKELELESSILNAVKNKQITVTLDENLLYSVKEILIKRKRKGIKPNTLSGIVRETFKDVVKKELDK